MAIAILVGRDEAERNNYLWFISDWQKALIALNPALDIRVWPVVGDPAEIDFALVWNHPFGVLKNFPNLKAIASLAAGVDHILKDKETDKTIPIVRLIDPYMANDIVQYVVACVLNYVKLMDHWLLKQQQKIWFKQPPFNFSDRTIGVMGLGFLGGKAAKLLSELGLNVIGWSRSPKNFPMIKTFAGEKEFTPFLSQTDILICMVPLTPETKDILNKQNFSYLKKGAYLINVGRGEHLIEEDLLQALNDGQLSGAALDVFRNEPLTSDHPFWQHPKIRVTPHIASVTNPITAAPQMLINYERALKGETLLNQIDFEKGY